VPRRHSAQQWRDAMNKVESLPHNPKYPSIRVPELHSHKLVGIALAPNGADYWPCRWCLGPHGGEACPFYVKPHSDKNKRHWFWKTHDKIAAQTAGMADALEAFAARQGRN
jgi:hypothetical protein